MEHIYWEGITGHPPYALKNKKEEAFKNARQLQEAGKVDLFQRKVGKDELGLTIYQYIMVEK